MFALSILFFFLATKTKSKILKIIYIAIGIFLPCIMSALRADTVGTDMQVYIKRWFNIAEDSSSFSEYIGSVNSTEYGYLFLNYIISKIPNSFQFFLFITQLLTILPFTIIAYKRKNINPTILMAFYLIFFYSITLNMARQSLSLSFSMLALYFMLEKKNTAAILTFIISILFHSSAIIGLIIPILYFTRNQKIHTPLFIILLILTFVFLFNFQETTNFLLNAKIIPDKYIIYNSEYILEEIDIPIVKIFFYILFALPAFFARKNIDLDKSKTSKLYTELYILGILLVLLGSISHFADRIGYTLLFPLLFFYLPQICNKKNSKKYIILVMISVSAWWIFWIGIQNVHQTMPYLVAINHIGVLV